MATRQTSTKTVGNSILGSLKGGKAAKAETAEVVADKVTVAAETVEVVAGTVEVQEPKAEVSDAGDASTVSEASEAKSEDSGAADVEASSAFSWDSLPAAEVVVYSRAVVKTDLEASTPEFIKSRVNDAFAKTQEAGTDDKGQPKPVYLIQNCGTAERAEEFLKLARKYASFLDRTLRGEANPAKVKTAQGFVSGVGMVSFAVKPKETRTRVAKASK